MTIPLSILCIRFFEEQTSFVTLPLFTLLARRVCAGTVAKLGGKGKGGKREKERAESLPGTFEEQDQSVKNAEQVLFHSTLEPNTEVFSKVSCGVLRSTKFHLNFAKQRRNDMQPS